MHDTLTLLIFLAGIGQLGVLVAAALVPLRLQWATTFAGLPKLQRQLCWVYAGYIVLAIVAFGTISITCAADLAAGGPLARALSGYMAVFWGIRLCLQAVLDVKDHLTAWWLNLGYQALTLLFISFTAVFGYAALAAR